MKAVGLISMKFTENDFYAISYIYKKTHENYVMTSCFILCLIMGHCFLAKCIVTAMARCLIAIFNFGFVG